MWLFRSIELENHNRFVVHRPKYYYFFCINSVLNLLLMGLYVWSAKSISIKRKKINSRNVLYKMSHSAITLTSQNILKQSKKNVKIFIGKCAKLFSKSVFSMQLPEIAKGHWSRNVMKILAITKWNLKLFVKLFLKLLVILPMLSLLLEMNLYQVGNIKLIKKNIANNISFG